MRRLPGVAPSAHLPLIDIGPLMTGQAGGVDAQAVARQVDQACRSLGFFRIIGHGIDHSLMQRIDRLSRQFFDQPNEVKAAIAMPLAGSAWRGWFPVGDEVTSAVPDRKEGLYIGLEHPADHPRVIAGTPLHGSNQFPSGGLGNATMDLVNALVPVANAVMRGIALGLGLPAEWFEANLTADPTVLFRIFHYPALPDNDLPDQWGVGEHTDYGLLTLLAQDQCGGLQVRTPDGEWIEVPAEPDVLVCNLGDMLDRLTEGRYRSTPHRVRNLSGQSRLSFPFFFDPSWDAVVTPLPFSDSAPADEADRRWDGTSPQAWTGTYGDYLSAKVARVFPDLFATITGNTITGNTITSDAG
jgi:isopenicillin N synthase-like dioxygenase